MDPRERIAQFEILDELPPAPPFRIFRANDVDLSRSVELTVLRNADESDLDAVAKRARVLVSLSHPDIAQTLGVIKLPDGICVVSELMGGTRIGPAPRPNAVNLMKSVAEVMVFAHDMGILLGLTPAAIDTHPDQVKVRPWLGRLSRDGPGPLPDSGYVAPEIMTDGHAPDILTDIYSFGAVFYDRLAGPRITANIRPPLSEVAPDVPPELCAIIMTALHPDRNRRYQTSEALLKVLDRLIAFRQSALDLAATKRISVEEFFTAAPPVVLPEPPAPVDEDVQFTIYRPQTLPPGAWKTLLAFAHRSSGPSDASPDEPDPLKEVQKQAETILGKQVEQYRNTSQDSGQAIPREGTLTFLPDIKGITFEPKSHSLVWEGRVHPAVFLLCASKESLGKTLRGQLSIFLGNIIVAQVPLSVRVENQSAAADDAPAFVREEAAWYRRIFASYSHKDVAIVEEFERHAIAFGDDYLRDLTRLRAGMKWDEGLRKMIRDADVFQLFWSHNSMNSDYVRQEYTYALSLGRDRFIRPVYWEEPLPESRAEGLPPAELQQIHFHRIAPGVRRTQATSTRISAGSPPPERVAEPRDTAPMRTSYASAPPPRDGWVPAGSPPSARKPARMPRAAYVAMAGVAFVTVIGVGLNYINRPAVERVSLPSTSPAPAAGAMPAMPAPTASAPAPSAQPTAQFLISVTAGGTPLTDGMILHTADMQLGALGPGSLKASVRLIDGAIPDDAVLTVQWELDDLVTSTNRYTGSDFKGKQVTAVFDAAPTPGNYGVRLFVNGRAPQLFTFTIAN